MGATSVSLSNVQSVTVGDHTRLVRTWERPDRPWASVLLVHGIAEHSGRYELVGRQLAESGLKVRSFDLPGFGGTGGRRGHVDSFDEYLDAVGDELVSSTEAGLPTVLLGHSLGGLIALKYALDRTPAPDYLVLSAPAIDANVPAWQRTLAPLLARIAPKLTIPNPVDGEQLSRDPSVAERYFADPLVYTKASTRMGAEMFDAMKAVVGRVPAMPTHIVHGGADELVPAHFSAPLGEKVSRKLYPSLRHEVFNEPEGPEVIADIVSWLKEQIN